MANYCNKRPYWIRHWLIVCSYLHDGTNSGLLRRNKIKTYLPTYLYLTQNIPFFRGEMRISTERQCNYVGRQPTKTSRCYFSAACGRNAGTLLHRTANLPRLSVPGPLLTRDAATLKTKPAKWAPGQQVSGRSRSPAMGLMSGLIAVAMMCRE